MIGHRTIDDVADDLRTSARRRHRLGRGAHVVVDQAAVEAVMTVGVGDDGVIFDPPTETTPATVRA